MAKVTSKLQVTIPKALAERTGIRAGDDIEWSAAADGLRIAPAPARAPRDAGERLELFDRATDRQKRRQRDRKGASTSRTRGWTREDLYDRGRTR
jgi:AbrB family looped-hinge helix DNA binding protein